MSIYLETPDVYRILIDFPITNVPTCFRCGQIMNMITVMPECLYSIQKKISALEGQAAHIHFHHAHPNNDTLKTAFYCPIYNKKW